MNILIIAPHMDDETIGMGGTIAKHVAIGDKVHVAIIAHRVYERVYDEEINKQEMQATLASKDVLGYQEVDFFGLADERLDMCIQDILIPLENYYNKVKPDILYTNFCGDNNQDHRAVFDAVRVVIRPASTNKVKRVLMYETPSSTDQSPPLAQNIFLPNFYISIDGFLGKKLKALSFYEREKRAFPHPRSEEGVEVLARKRGMEAGLHLAEGFMMLRDEWV